jgi:hypothetical protein
MRKKKSAADKLAGYRRPRVMPGTLIYNAKDNTFRARFSRVYKPAGHNFIRAYTVVRSAYWLKYGLLDHNAVTLFDDLNFFCESDMLFTLRGLENTLRRTRRMIRDNLDQLENVELVQTLSLADMHGQPNYYVMCTPYFEDRDALTPSVVKRIRRDGHEPPKTFLVDHLARFKSALATNLAKERRNNPAKFPGQDERTHNWNEILKAFKSDVPTAIEFDRIVFDTTQHFAGGEYRIENFDKLVRYYCTRAKLKYTPRLKELSHNLAAFYERYHRNGAHAPAAPAEPEVSRAELVEMFRDMLSDGKWTPETLTQQFAQSFGAKDWSQILKAVTGK